jgi:hypothetical protein
MKVEMTISSITLQRWVQFLFDSPLQDDGFVCQNNEWQCSKLQIHGNETTMKPTASSPAKVSHSQLLDNSNS